MSLKLCLTQQGPQVLNIENRSKEHNTEKIDLQRVIDHEKCTMKMSAGFVRLKEIKHMEAWIHP